LDLVRCCARHHRQAEIAGVAKPPNDFAITADTPSIFRVCPACSRDDLIPKLRPATMLLQAAGQGGCGGAKRDVT
jgi:hypothetical protein